MCTPNALVMYRFQLSISSLLSQNSLKINAIDMFCKVSSLLNKVIPGRTPRVRVMICARALGRSNKVSSILNAP